MNAIQHMILTVSAATALVMAPAASALPLSITSGAFMPGSGYGVDSQENGATLLDVRFSTSGFAVQDFRLDNVGDYFTFKFGTVDFRETDAGNGSNAGIRAHETDYLDVMARLIFAGGPGIVADIAAAGTAIPGLIGDPAADYLLAWDPLTVDIGQGGKLEIAFAPLSFSGNGLQDQMATVTLLSLPQASHGQAVPEPATLSLLALGLLGFAVARGKSSKA
ncbi:MAG: hypothetical protein ABS91_00160 [Thiobacillus sp. SCN 64-35]|nr:MAG: hypothetical protein ABS91_00160 [Thiobacillus sp. SCN 64-35]